MSEEEEPQEEELMVAACPQCDTVARGQEEVDAVFGLRRSNNKVRPQSWCRQCRIKASAHRKRMKMEQEEQAKSEEE